MARKPKASTKPQEPLAIESDVRSLTTKALAKAFTKSSEALVDRLMILQHALVKNTDHTVYFDRSNKTIVGGTSIIQITWNPSDEFSSSKFARFASDTYEAWNIARHSSDEIAAFDGESLPPLVRLFESITDPLRDTASPAFAIFPELLCEFRHKIHQLLVKLPPKVIEEIDPLSRWEPTEAEIKRVEDAVAGMFGKNPGVMAVAKAAKMKKERAGAILKLLRESAE